MDIELVPNTLQYTGPSHMFPLKSLYEACFFLIMKKRYLIYKIKHSICHYYSYLLLTVRSLLKNNKVTFKKKTPESEIFQSSTGSAQTISGRHSRNGYWRLPLGVYFLFYLICRFCLFHCRHTLIFQVSLEA